MFELAKEANSVVSICFGFYNRSGWRMNVSDRSNSVNILDQYCLQFYSTAASCIWAKLTNKLVFIIWIRYFRIINAKCNVYDHDIY